MAMPEAKKPTILLVEDDLGHAKLIQKNLQRSGIRNSIVHLTNGQEAVDYLFSQGEYAGGEPAKQILILLDINMPELDGLQTLEIIKNDDRTKGIPVVMLTTSANQEEVKHCYSLGCSVYIKKPVEHEEFCNAIQKLGFFLDIVYTPE